MQTTLSQKLSCLTYGVQSSTLIALAATDPVLALFEGLGYAFGSNFLGTLLGDVFGGLFGDGYRGRPYAEAHINIVNGQFALIAAGQDNNGDTQEAVNLANDVAQIDNQVLASIGGTATASNNWSIGYHGTDYHSELTAQLPNETDYGDPNSAVAAAVIGSLKNTTITGGNPYMEYVLATTTDTNVQDFTFDLNTARDYSAYIADPVAFDLALAVSGSASQYQTWQAEYARAQQLGLTSMTFTFNGPGITEQISAPTFSPPTFAVIASGSGDQITINGVEVNFTEGARNGTLTGSNDPVYFGTGVTGITVAGNNNTLAFNDDPDGGAGIGVTINGSGNAVNLSNASTINFVEGSANNTANGSNDTITLGTGVTGMTITGNNDTVGFDNDADGGAGIALVIGGGNDVVDLSNASAIDFAEGWGNNDTVNGSNDAIYFGTAKTGMTIIGNNDTVSFDNDPNGGGGDQVIIAGGSDVVNLSNASTINFAEGWGNNDTVNGSNDAIYLGTGKTGMIVNGDNDTISFNSDPDGGAGSSVTVNGSNDTVDLSNAAINLGANGVNDTINGADNSIQIDDWVTAAINSSGDTVTIGSSDTIAINGVGETVNVTGDGGTVTVNGASASVHVTGLSDKINIDGSGENVTLDGGSNVAVASGQSETISANGQEVVVLSGSNGDVIAGTGNQIYLGTGVTGAVIVENNNTIGFDGDAGGGAGTQVVIGGGNDVVNLSNASMINFAEGWGNNDAVNGSNDAIYFGTGKTGMSVSGNNDTISFNGDPDGDTGISLVLNGANDTVNLSNAILHLGASTTSITVNGSNDTVHVEAGDTYTINGTGDTVITDTVVNAQNGTVIANYDGVTSLVDVTNLPFDPSITASFALNSGGYAAQILVSDHGSLVDTINLQSATNLGGITVVQDGSGGTLLVDPPPASSDHVTHQAFVDAWHLLTDGTHMSFIHGPDAKFDFSNLTPNAPLPEERHAALQDFSDYGAMLIRDGPDHQETGLQAPLQAAHDQLSKLLLDHATPSQAYDDMKFDFSSLPPVAPASSDFLDHHLQLFTQAAASLAGDVSSFHQASEFHAPMGPDHHDFLAHLAPSHDWHL